MFIDTHAHLDFDVFDKDVENVINNAQKNFVKKIITVGTSVKNSIKCIEIAEKFDDVFASVGVHPHYLNSFDFNEIKKLCKKKIIAIGEIGMDLLSQKKNVNEVRKKQKDIFEKQVDLAESEKLPVIVHARETTFECLEILENKKVEAVFHCFTGSESEAEKIIERGFFISFTGIITFPNSLDLQKVVKNVDIEKIMIETDSPFLAPQIVRGKKNTPVQVVEVAKKIAEIKKMDIEKVAEITTKNAERFFGI